MLDTFYQSWLYDLWLEFPPFHAPGFVTSLVVSGLAARLCFTKLRAKTWSVFLKSLAVAACCFVSLLVFAIVGIFVVRTGILGMARGWASFADAYVWGVISLPPLAFFMSLACHALTIHSRGTR